MCTKIWSRIVVQCQKALVCKFQKTPMKGEEMQERCMGKTNKMRVLWISSVLMPLPLYELYKLLSVHLENSSSATWNWTVSELLKICRWKDPFRMKNWWEHYFCCEIIWYCGVLTFTYRISTQILNLFSENKDNFLTPKTSTGNLSSYSTIYGDEYSFQTPTTSVCKENKRVSDTISWTQTSC